MKLLPKLPPYLARTVELLLVVTGIVVLMKFTVLRPRTVRIATVTRGDLSAEVEGTGTVTSDVLANVGPKINGRVERVFVDERDTVRAGQIVALLDDTDIKKKIDQAKAQLASTRVTAWEQQREWNREQTLVVNGARTGVEDHLELSLVFLLKRIELPSEVGV